MSCPDPDPPDPDHNPDANLNPGPSPNLNVHHDPDLSPILSLTLAPIPSKADTNLQQRSLPQS